MITLYMPGTQEGQKASEVSITRLWDIFKISQKQYFIAEDSIMEQYINV